MSCNFSSTTGHYWYMERKNMDPICMMLWRRGAPKRIQEQRWWKLCVDGSNLNGTLGLIREPTCTSIYVQVISGMYEYMIYLPVVPYKAATEISEKEAYRRVWLSWITDGRWIHWWTERWLELCFLEWLQWLQRSPGRSPHPQLLKVVWCSAAVVVVVM